MSPVFVARGHLGRQLAQILYAIWCKYPTNELPGRTGGGDWAFLSFPVLRQQPFNDFFAIAEIRLLQPLDSTVQIDQLALGGQVQDAEGAGGFQTLTHGGSITSALVDENEIGLERDPKRDGGAFAGIESGEARIVVVHRFKHGLPCWGRFDPRLDRRWCRGIAKFARHLGRNRDGFKEAVKEIDMPDLHQVTDGAGVSDNQQHH